VRPYVIEKLLEKAYGRFLAVFFKELVIPALEAQHRFREMKLESNAFQLATETFLGETIFKF